MPLSTSLTSRFGLRALTGTNLVSDIDAGIKALADDVDAALYPPGDLRFTAKAALDDGWLRCEGQTVSRATYKALFEAIGTAYGIGNGVSTFGLPDYRERVPMGAGPTNLRGTILGEATHKLTAAELAAHAHSTHVVYPAPGEHVGGAVLMRDNFVAFAEADIPTGVAGGDTAHNNIQPSTVCNVWIRT